MTRCTFDPRTLIGQPIGMLHCDGCDGCMVVAGLPHGPCEPWCRWQDDGDRKLLAEMDAELRRLADEEETHRATPDPEGEHRPDAG